MHQYEIMYTDYSEQGAPTNNKHYIHPANIAECKQKYEELSRQQRTVVVNEETGETKTYKAYKVEVKVATYKTIDKPDDLWAMFGV